MRTKILIFAGGLFIIAALLSFSFISSSADSLPTPAAPLYTAAFTPEPYVFIDMYELDEDGAKIVPTTRCNVASTKWGCTAFCNNPWGVCNLGAPTTPKSYGSYAGSNSSRLVLSIEGLYLPDVIEQEIGSGSPLQAIQAQAIAARSFTHYYIENGAKTATSQPGATPTNTPGPGILTATPHMIGTPYDNSTKFQAFIPYKFTTLNLTATPNLSGNLCASTNLNALQTRLCAQATPRYYISQYGYDLPAEALFSGDVIGQTGAGTKPYQQSVSDPISNSCDAANTTAFGWGLSQQGARRWAQGNQCGLPGNGNQPWNVSWSTSQQILFHYFTGVELFSMASGHPRQSAVLRWNPLNLTGLQRQLRYGQYMELTIPVQNTGVSTWTCAAGVDYRLGYKWSYSASPWTATTTTICGLAPGGTRAVTMQVNTTGLVPNADNNWTLSISMAEYDNGTPYWFHNQSPSWPAYTIGTQIRVCGTVGSLCGFGYIPMMVGDGAAFNSPNPTP